jgi:cyclopropane-fatty-acyl-phospholipid synthase
LSIATAKGAQFTFGDGFGETAAVRILTSSAERQLLMDPELALGELFMDGSLILERGTIADLLGVALGYPDVFPPFSFWRCLETWAKRRLSHRFDRLAFGHPKRCPLSVFGDEESTKC